jgi:hypothetical protein
MGPIARNGHEPLVVLSGSGGSLENTLWDFFKIISNAVWIRSTERRMEAELQSDKWTMNEESKKVREQFWKSKSIRILI